MDKPSEAMRPLCSDNMTATAASGKSIASRTLTQGQPAANFTPVTGSGGTAPLSPVDGNIGLTFAKGQIAIKIKFSPLK